MSSNTTGAMQQFGAPAAPQGTAGATHAGLILLYADEYPQLQSAWPLASKRMVIGREDADITVGVHSVSRQHAEVSWDGDEWRIRDLGSTNGTLVDGHRIQETTLENLHEVRVGDVILKFVESGCEQHAGYVIDGGLRPGAARRCQGGTKLVGGYQMDRIAADVSRIAPAELSVMLLGESGTGKEVVARELHRMSERSGEFNAVNCAAIPGSLLESELFGYKRGAFSGAERDKPGLIRAADQGTLLLDEIGDMPLEAQAKLLRVLQSKEVFPLGATRPEPVDVRIVCATHRDLWRLQQDGRFREDLFARLNEYQLRLPPLRERKEDIYMLVLSFLARHGRPELKATFRFMTGLMHYDWPYNVRELEACIKRCIALSDGSALDAEQLPPQIAEVMRDYDTAPRPTSPPSTERRISAPPDAANPSARIMPTADELRALLTAHQGNVAAVGRQLGKARMQIHRWMKRYGINIDDYRA